MGAQTYGVTYSTIEAELRGADLASISTDIDRWVTHYSALINSTLRANGYTPETIEGLGSTDDLYRMCQYYVIQGVLAKVARSGGFQDVSIAQKADEERALVEERIRAMPLSVSDTADPEVNRGGALTNLDTQTRRRRRHRSTFWRRNETF